MKDFNEFLDTLTQDVINGIIADVNMKANNTVSIPTTKGQRRAYQTTAISMTIAIELLGCYHKWLHENQ